MRKVDLYYHDVFDGVDLATICELMTTIEAGHTNTAEFEVLEPGQHKEILFVYGVVVLKSQAIGWILEKKRGKKRLVLGLGTARNYVECMWWVCPERIRADCFLSLNDAIPSIERIVDGKKMTPPFHWVAREDAYAPHPE